MILFFVFSYLSAQTSYIDGFVNFNFTFSGDRISFFSNLSIRISTIENSLIDQVEVQPSGYWISDADIPYRANISILSPNGICFEEKSKIISFSENTSINFLVTGFEINGSVLVSSDNPNNFPVSVPLKLEIYRYSSQTRFIIDIIAGSFSLDNIIPGLYRFNILNVNFNQTNFKLTDKPLLDIKLIIDSWDPHGIVIVPPTISIFPLNLSIKSEFISKEITTDRSGNFILKNLPKGTYEISCKNKNFNISKINFTIGENALTELIKLHYLGTSARGSILFQPGKPCSGAIIKFIQQNMTVLSDSDGKFTFYNVMPINYAIFTAEYELWGFENQILSSIKNFPQKDLIFRATHGPVHGESSCLEYNVSIGSNPELLIQTKNGSFSLSAPIKVLSMITLSTTCKMKNDTAIIKAPINLFFSQISSKIFGSVILSLRIPIMTVYLIGNKTYKTRCTENGRFSLENVDFGEYKILLIYPKSVIYNQTTFYVNVTTEEVNLGSVARFDHYFFNFKSNHEISILAGQKIVKLNKGNNLVHVVYRQILSADCYNFENPKIPKKIFVKNFSDENFDNSTKIEDFEDFTYNLTVTEAVRKVEVTGDLMIHQTTIKVNNKPLKFPYKFIQKYGQSVKVECIVQNPFAVDNPKRYIEFPSKCDEIISFDVYKNYEIEGKIIPPIKSVNVSVIFDDKVISWILTDKDGRYFLSRLPTLAKLILKAEKRRFKFVLRKNTYDFDAYRLFNINLTFPDSVNDGIVSISNSNGFSRIKKITNSSVTFENLTEGDYFVKPIMKEFDFNPSIKEFSLFENDVSFAFEASKNRFSISGFVFDQNNKPVKNKTVFVNSVYEKKTDNSGKFTFMDLKSNEDYELSIQKSENEVVTPITQNFTLKRENINDVKFKVIKRNEKFDLFGQIYSTDFELTQLSVLIKDERKVIDVFEFKSSLPNFFFIGLEKEKQISLQIFHKTFNGNIFVCYETAVKNTDFVNATCVSNEGNDVKSEEYSSFEASLCVMILFIILFVLYNIRFIYTRVTH